MDGEETDNIFVIHRQVMAVVAYASYSEFTAVYSVRGITQDDLETYWLSYGTLRTDEALGGYFSTPFSSNNETAKDLSIHQAYLGIQARQRTGQTADIKVKEEIEDRLTSIRCGNTPLILTDGTAMYAQTAKVDAWSTTQEFENTFNQLNPIFQQKDTDQLEDLLNRQQ